jgi:hypothetical protein
MPVPQQQKAFEEHMRNIRKTVGGCLKVLTRPGDDFTDCEPLFIETEKELDNLGLFLRSNSKENLPEILNNPHNALLYFNQMAHVQQMFLLMLCYKAPIVRTAAEAFAAVFQTKHEHIYTKYTAKKTSLSSTAANRQAKKKALIPLIMASTYVAPKMMIEALNKSAEKDDKTGDDKAGTIIQEMRDLREVIAQSDDDIFTESSVIKNSNFLLFYKGVNPFLARFSDKMLKINDKKGWLSSIADYVPFFKPWFKLENNAKENNNKKEGGMVDNAIKEESDMFDRFVGEEHPASYLVGLNIRLAYVQTDLAVFPDIFQRLPTQLLTESHFKDEIDYRFYLFFNQPLHKISSSAFRNDGMFGQTRSLVAGDINNTIVPAIKKIEQKQKDDAGYALTKEEKELISSVFQRIHVLLYAQVCDRVWLQTTGEPLWKRVTYKNNFAGFEDKTIANIKYLYDLYFEKK